MTLKNSLKESGQKVDKVVARRRGGRVTPVTGRVDALSAPPPALSRVTSEATKTRVSCCI